VFQGHPSTRCNLRLFAETFTVAVAAGVSTSQLSCLLICRLTVRRGPRANSSSAASPRPRLPQGLVQLDRFVPVAQFASDGKLKIFGMR